MMATISVISTILLSGHLLFAQDIPAKPLPPRLVNDFAAVFTQQQADSLEQKLVAYNDSTTVQIAVVTIPTLDGYDSGEYAVKLHRLWGVGHAEKDNGIVILVKPKTEEEGGDVFISIGYGLEGNIPDIYAKRIIERIMIPNFKKEDYFAAADEASTSLMQLASGQENSISKQPENTTTGDEYKYDPENTSVWEIILGVFVFLLLLSPILYYVFYFVWSLLDLIGTVIGVRIVKPRPVRKGSGSGSSRDSSSSSSSRSSSSSSSSRSSGGFGGFGGGSAGGGGAGGKW